MTIEQIIAELDALQTKYDNQAAKSGFDEYDDGFKSACADIYDDLTTLICKIQDSQ